VLVRDLVGTRRGLLLGSGLGAAMEVKSSGNGWRASYPGGTWISTGNVSPCEATATVAVPGRTSGRPVQGPPRGILIAPDGVTVTAQKAATAIPIAAARRPNAFLMSCREPSAPGPHNGNA
jgi:hypothetical protein